MRGLLRLLGLVKESRVSTPEPPATTSTPAPVIPGVNTIPAPAPAYTYVPAIPNPITEAEFARLVRNIDGLNMDKRRAGMLLYLDRSGSTEDQNNQLWGDGTMQQLTATVAAIAASSFSVTHTAVLRFFHAQVVRPAWPDDGLIRPSNVNQILDQNRSIRLGGTHFLPVLMDMVRQALLLNARSSMTPGRYLDARLETIEKMSDDQLLKFITPELDDDGNELLKPIMKLPYLMCAFMGTDGLPSEELEYLLQVLRWMSQLGILVMLAGVGNHQFGLLKGMDKAGEDLFLKKGYKPLWDNAEFVDLKSLTGDVHQVPDGTAIMRLVIDQILNKAHPACTRLRLIIA